MKRTSTVLYFLIFLAFLSGSYRSDADSIKIYGTVTDKESGLAIPEATVLFISGYTDTLRTTTDTSGNYELFVLSTSVETPPLPESFLLRQNYPNPFNPTTVIEYQIQRADIVNLSIYNILGQKVRQLVNDYQTAGIHRVQWDGTDDSRNSVATGVYLYHVRMGEHSATRKMLLLDGGTGRGSSDIIPPVSNIRKKTYKKSGDSITYKVAVKHNGYVTYEDYGFTAAADTLVNISLEKKSGVTLYGSLQYNPCYKCRTDNWNGIIDPLTIIVYDTNDYSTKLSMTTIEYPDTTFEITGLPDSVIIDLVIEGDDVISEKSSEIAIEKGNVTLEKSTIEILYNMDASIRPYIHNKIFYIHLKHNYNNLHTAEQIFLEYGYVNPQSFGSGNDPSYAATIPEDNPNNSAQMVKVLNHDIRIQYSSVGGFAVSAK